MLWCRFDAFLIKAKDDDLSKKVLELKRQIRKAREQQPAFASQQS